MPTQQDMINRIAAELGSRFDLAGPAIFNAATPNSNAIRNAITTSISEYRKQRFRFNETDPSNPGSFQTSAVKSVYTNADSPLIGSAYYIDYLNIVLGNTLVQLYRNDPETQHLNIQLNNQNGMPISWAYEGNAIILYPVPDIAYTIYIGSHLDLPGPTDDLDATNVWMNTAELLIRCRSKWEIATNVTRNKDMAIAMSPDIDGGPSGGPGATYRAWRSLKGETNKITSLGRVRAMQF